MSENNKLSGCSVLSPTLIQAWAKSKKEFDDIALPETIHPWKECPISTLIHNNGQKWERRFLSKIIDAEPIYVVFEWYEERPILLTESELGQCNE